MDLDEYLRFFGLNRLDAGWSCQEVNDALITLRKLLETGCNSSLAVLTVFGMREERRKLAE